MSSEKEADFFLIRTTGSTQKLEIKWIFQNATTDWPNKEIGKRMSSPVSHAKEDEEVKWRINIYPNGNLDQNQGYMSAYLRLHSCPAHRLPIKAKFSFSLYDEEKKELLFPCREIKSHLFRIDSDCHWGWGQFANHSEVLERKTFSFTCKLEYEDSRTTSSTSILPGLSMQPSNEETNSSLDQNLELLFTNQLATDVSFIVDGKEIKAHKAILSARSPVFAAMLLSGMKESAENRVEIDDIAPDIFEALLRFIYTDRIDLTTINTKDLLAAANKYLLPLLKFQCQRFLSESINIENCVELLALADLHNAEHLKKSALNFTRRYHAEIIQTEGWKDLKQSRPELAFVFDFVDSIL